MTEHLSVSQLRRATLAFLAREIDPGQLRHVEEQLPGEVRQLTPDTAAA